MSQLWAIVAPNHAFRIVFTDSADVSPADCGHADECEDMAVWPLEREPDIAHGELVDFATGSIIYCPFVAQPGWPSAYDMLIAEIKAEAGRRILEAYPLWKQLNDMDLSAFDPGVLERKAERDRIRDWSNELEDRVDHATSLQDLCEIRKELTT